MQVARNQHTATLLADGKVLLAAGSTDAIYLNSAEVFDPTNNSFTLAGSLAVARKSHTETLLPSGQVLITGGKTGEFRQSLRGALQSRHSSICQHRIDD